jgi:hypothetical protein
LRRCNEAPKSVHLVSVGIHRWSCLQWYTKYLSIVNMSSWIHSNAGGRQEWPSQRLWYEIWCVCTGEETEARMKLQMGEWEARRLTTKKSIAPQFWMLQDWNLGFDKAMVPLKLQQRILACPHSLTFALPQVSAVFPKLQT